MCGKKSSDNEPKHNVDSKVKVDCQVNNETKSEISCNLCIADLKVDVTKQPMISSELCDIRRDKSKTLDRLVEEMKLQMAGSGIKSTSLNKATPLSKCQDILLSYGSKDYLEFKPPSNGDDNCIKVPLPQYSNEYFDVYLTRFKAGQQTKIEGCHKNGCLIMVLEGSIELHSYQRMPTLTSSPANIDTTILAPKAELKVEPRIKVELSTKDLHFVSSFSLQETLISYLEGEEYAYKIKAPYEDAMTLSFCGK